MKIKIRSAILLLLYCSTATTMGASHPVSKRIQAGTRILVKIDQNITSKSAKMGEPVPAVVSSDVIADKSITIASGARCDGQITQVRKAWYLGQPGMVQLQIKYVQAVDGSLIPVTGGVITNEGSSKQTESVVIAYVLCIFFALLHGDEGEIPLGTVVECYTASAKDILLDEATP